MANNTTSYSSARRSKMAQAQSKKSAATGKANIKKKKPLQTAAVKKVVGGLGAKQHNEVLI